MSVLQNATQNDSQSVNTQPSTLPDSLSVEEKYLICAFRAGKLPQEQASAAIDTFINGANSTPQDSDTQTFQLGELTIDQNLFLSAMREMSTEGVEVLIQALGATGGVHSRYKILEGLSEADKAILGKALKPDAELTTRNDSERYLLHMLRVGKLSEEAAEHAISATEKGINLFNLIEAHTSQQKQIGNILADHMEWAMLIYSSLVFQALIHVDHNPQTAMEDMQAGVKVIAILLEKFRHEHVMRWESL